MILKKDGASPTLVCTNLSRTSAIKESVKDVSAIQWATIGLPNGVEGHVPALTVFWLVASHSNKF